jgi:Domain of unknown function (DUF4499)
MSSATDRRDTFVPVATHWYVSNLGGVIATGILARRTGKRLIRWTFWGAATLHVTEAAYANYAARKAGFTNSAWKWGLQTLAVGFPSLLALRAAVAAGGLETAALPSVSELRPEGERGPG